MSTSAARRRFGFLVALAVAAVPLVAQPLPAAATSNGTLFAITGNNQSVLSRIDPVSGVVTTIEDLAGPDQGQLVSLTGDPATHRLFAIRSSTIFIPPTTINVKNELLIIDSLTFAFTASPSTSVPTSQIQFDQSSGALYGIAHEATGVGTFGLFIDQVNLATGAGTPIAPLADVGSDVLGLAVAPGLHTIYVNDESLGIGSPAGSRVLTVDLQTKAVTPSPTLNRAVRNIAYDSSSHLLFGTTECCPRDLVQINPATGEETLAGNINDGSGIFTFPMATDPATHKVFMDIQLPLDFINWEDHIVSINDVTGVTAFSPATGAMAWSLYFESGTAPADTSPPITSASISPAPNGAGWNHADVTVNLSATDPDGAADVATVQYSATGAQVIATTIVAGSSASFSLSAEGLTTVTFLAKDQAGNSEAAKSLVVRIDKTQPTITYAGNAGIYTVDQTVAITCTAVDPANGNGTAGSGLASSTCANVNAPAYSFPLGSNTLSASATDIAANVGNGSTTFMVQVTFSSLCTLTLRFIESSPAFQARPALGHAQGERLCKLLAKAGSLPDRVKKGLVEVYQKGLPHLVEKGFLTPAEAALLLTLSKAL